MATLVSDLINQAFIDLAVIQPGEGITADMQTEAFRRLNQLLASWSTEGATVFTETLQSFNLLPGVSAYALGMGGSWNTALRAQKIVSWSAGYAGLVRKGGQPLPFSEFAALARDDKGTQSAIPEILGADSAYPLINVRVFPPPSNTPGFVELAYWTPITQFVAVGDPVNLPQGFEEALHFNLAVLLYPQYARPQGLDSALAANAQNSKASIIQQNTINGVQPGQPAAAAAPQQQ